MLLSPRPIRNKVKQSDSSEKAEKPDINEMDMMYKSFAPGLSETQRYTIQDRSAFYKSQFPNSAYNSRINNF